MNPAVRKVDRALAVLVQVVPQVVLAREVVLAPEPELAPLELVLALLEPLERQQVQPE